MTVELLDGLKGDHGIRISKVFNEKPKKAINEIKWLMIDHIKQQGTKISEQELNRMIAEQIAAFFIKNKNNLDLTKVGDFIGDDPKFSSNHYNALVLNEMAKNIDMVDAGDNSYLTSLRRFVSQFVLPGEAQKIDRIMLAFANNFVDSNHSHRVFTVHAEDISDYELESAVKEYESKINALENTSMPTKESIAAEKSKDLPYQIAFAVMTLQTSLHNPNVPDNQRLTEDQFVGICNDFHELDESYLRDIYKDVKANEFELTFSKTSPGISFSSGDLAADSKFKDIVSNAKAVGYGEKIGASKMFPEVNPDLGYEIEIKRNKKRRSFIGRIFGGYNATAIISKDGRELAKVSISKGGMLSKLFGRKESFSIEPIDYDDLLSQSEALKVAGIIAKQVDCEPTFTSNYAYECEEMINAYSPVSSSILTASEPEVDLNSEITADLLYEARSTSSAPGLLSDLRDMPSAPKVSASSPSIKNTGPEKNL